MIYSIPECNMENLEKKILRIKNKCAKYGCDFKFEQVGEHFEERMIADTIIAFGKEVDVPSGKKEIVRFIDIECEGTAKINGWQFVASLEHTEKGNIISGVPGIEVPSRYYSCGPWCEHCKERRDRKQSFIVLNEKTGEFKQVGRSCLQDFTGGLSAEWAAQVESFFKEAAEASEFTGLGAWSKRYYNVQSFLVCCAETIRIFGYTKNGGETRSTSSRASAFYCVENGMRVGKYDLLDYDDAVAKGFNTKREDSIALAKDVADWIKGSDNDTNYFHNLKVACSLEWCGGEKIGLLASAFPAYDRNLEIQAEKKKRELENAKEAEASDYVGEVGKRLSIVPTEVKCVTSWDTIYGMTYIFKFFDSKGNVFTWKTGKFIPGDAKVAKITGTVKSHKEYRGVKQTEMTRCSVVYEDEKVA